MKLFCDFEFVLFYSFKQSQSVQKLADEDADVAVERKRVSDGSCDGCPLLLNDLTKVYSSNSVTVGGCYQKTRMAVNSLSLGLQPTEVSSLKLFVL